MPRLPGSGALTDVEDFLAEELQRLGYQVTATRFAVHSPLDAVSVLGTGLGWLALLTIPLVSLPFPPWGALLFLAVAGLALAVVGWGLASGSIPNPRSRAEVRNLEGHRGAPRIWLVAHSDSKGQGLSLRGRVVAVVVGMVGIAILAVLAGLRLTGPLPWAAAFAGAVPALLAGGLLSRSRARDDSPGAVDNATGVIAVLTAAEALANRSDVGILITGAEEYAMAGARVWSAETARREAFINFDGIDSQGQIRVMSHGGQGAIEAEAGALANQLVEGLRATGVPVQAAPLPPGVLVDGTVLSRAGMPGVTVSRGTWATLGVVHTAGDVAERVDPEAAAAVGRAVAAVLARRLS